MLRTVGAVVVFGVLSALAWAAALLLDRVLGVSSPYSVMAAPLLVLATSWVAIRQPWPRQVVPPRRRVRHSINGGSIVLLYTKPARNARAES